MTWRLLMVSFGSQRPTNFKMVMEYKPNITYISMAYNFIRLVDRCVLNILTSWMLCGSVVLLNENIWEIVKSWRGQLPKKLFWSILKSRVWLASVQIFNFRTLAVTPVTFFAYKYHFVDKYWTNTFSLNLLPVSYLSQAASDGFNQKGWIAIAKLKPLVDRYSCQPMRRLDASNNLSVGPLVCDGCEFNVQYDE